MRRAMILAALALCTPAWGATVSAGSFNLRAAPDILGCADVRAFGAKGDGATDDTTAIQGAIDARATAGGGCVLLPPLTFRITTAILMKSKVWLRGSGARVLYQATGANWWLRGGQVGMSGSILLQTSASKDGILIQNADGTGAPLDNVAVTDLGVMFGANTSIDPQSAGTTGHGIDVKPPASGTSVRNSVVNLTIDRVVVYGHDGDHYAMWLEGINTSYVGSVTAYGGGCLRFAGPDGNSQFAGPFQGFWQNIGTNTARGFYFGDGSGNPLNYNSFGLFQCNKDFGSGGTQPILYFHGLGSSNTFAVLDAETFSGTQNNDSLDGSNVSITGGQFGLTFHSGAGRKGVLVYQGSNSNATDGAIVIRSGSWPTTSNLWYADFNGAQHFTGATYATLGTPANGSIQFCTDCNIANPCTSGGSGAFAKRLAGAWVCN